MVFQVEFMVYYAQGFLPCILRKHIFDWDDGACRCHNAFTRLRREDFATLGTRCRPWSHYSVVSDKDKTNLQSLSVAGFVGRWALGVKCCELLACEILSL